MSRLPTLDAVDIESELKHAFDPFNSRYGESKRLDDFSVFTPLHYEKKYDYPLLVWLHGAGDDEYQLRTIMPILSMQNFVGVGPRGTQAETLKVETPVDQGQNHSRRTYRWCQTEDQIELASQKVFHCIEDVQHNLSINPQRIFIGGMHNGGTMALRIAMNHPQQFAGVITVGGELPQGYRPLSCIHSTRSLPLLITNGLQSKEYPEADLCRDLRLLHSAGVNVSLRLYPCEDELITNMLEDMNRWMMQQICPDPAYEATTTFVD